VPTRPSHGVNRERHEHSCLTTHSPLLYPNPTSSPNRGVLSAEPCISSAINILHLPNWNYEVPHHDLGLLDFTSTNDILYQLRLCLFVKSYLGTSRCPSFYQAIIVTE
jgi:hypothetical protein